MSKSVGKSVPRLDGYGKVTGLAEYIDDISIPGCWYAAVVRATVPYGKIKKITYAPSFDWSKVTTCNYKDIPGKNATIFLTEDQPVLAKDVVRHVGEAIVLVAAATKELAREARDKICVEYEKLTPVLSIEESRAKKGVVWGEDNIQSGYHIIKGDIKKGFGEADHIVEDEYRTGFHEHIYIEPQGMAAVPRKDGGLTVMGSCQCPFYVLKSLKSFLDVDETKLNVVQTTMGGAFGGKEDYPSLMGSYVALLATKSGKPVKLVYERDEDILVTTKRHPSIVTHKTGVKKDGTITAMEIDVAFEGGAYVTMSKVVLSRGVIHAAGPYKCKNVESKAACYATNQVPTGAYRGFGVPQVLYALEMHIDKVAEKIGMNPYEFRFKNCVHIGDTLSTTQLLKESVAAEEVLVKASKAADFEKKWEANRREIPGSIHQTTKKGIGLSLYMHGGAFTGSGEAVMKTEVALGLRKDGAVDILTGVTDMGQGAYTVLPQIGADILGIPYDLVSCVSTDTAVVPDSGPTVASRVTMVIGSTVEKCAHTLKKKFLSYVAEQKAKNVDDLDIKDGVVLCGDDELGSFKEFAKACFTEKGDLYSKERYILPPGIKWDAEKHLGDAYPTYSWAADIAEVTVDTETFEVTVDKMTMAVDVGKAINPLLVEGQIEGGTLQALGYGLMEEMKHDEGHLKNNRLQTYIVPTIKDTPEWNTIILEYPFSAGPQGAKGVGELPLNGGAPAIANAIYNAIGIRIKELPITPEKLFEKSKPPFLEDVAIAKGITSRSSSTCRRMNADGSTGSP